MKVKLLLIGKTNIDFLIKGIEEYEQRLKHYLTFEKIIIPNLKNTKNLNENQQKLKEGELILSQINSPDCIILLDERGKQYSSLEFSGFIQKKMTGGLKSMIFVVGGAYGFSDELYKRGNYKISLSKMTFSHQMVRLIFLEQLYRAMTIIRGEPYHHE